MITNQQAELLLSLPKYIVENDRKLDTKQFDQPTLWDIRFFLIGEHENDVFECLVGHKRECFMELYW